MYYLLETTPYISVTDISMKRTPTGQQSRGKQISNRKMIKITETR